MSFYLKLIGDEMFYGGMQSIDMDYESIASVSIIREDMALTRPVRLFAIGGATQTAYMKGRLGKSGLWTADEIQKAASLQGFRLLAVYKDSVHHYSDRGIDIHPIVDEHYEFLHGTTRAQMEDAIEGVMVPTRWTNHYTQVNL